jgi:hypothetical protein
MDGTIVHMKVECSKDQLPVRRPSRREIRRENRAPSRQQARSSESSESATAQNRQPGQNRQSTATTAAGQQNRHKARHSLHKTAEQAVNKNEYSLPQESRITEKRPSARSGNQQAKRQSQKTKPECLEDDRQGPRICNDTN